MPTIAIKNAIHAFCPSALKPILAEIEASEIGYRLAKGTFWSIAGTIISRGLMFGATIIVARMLGKIGYGELGMIQSTVGMIGVFAGFGLGLTATKHVAEFRQRDPERAGRIIGISGLVAVITGSLMALGLFAFAPWIAKHSINAPHLAGVLRIGAIMLFINALNGAQTGALAGFEAFKTITIVNLLVGLFSFPILVGGVWFGGLTGAVWGLTINLGFNWLINHIALRKEARQCGVHFTLKGCSLEFPILWRFSLPAVLAGGMVGPVTWACNAMLVNQKDGYAGMGVFSAALVFQNILLFASQMLNAPLLSILSNTGSAKSHRLETANILSSWGIGLLPAILFLLFPEIVGMLFGKQFQGASFRVTFAIVVFYTCILTYRSGLLRVLQSKSLLWLGLCNNLLWAAVLLLSAHFLVKLGAVGLAASYAIAYVVISLVFVPIYIKRCEISRALLVSKEPVFIWLVIIILLTSTIWDIPILFRVLATPFILSFIGFELKAIWLRNAR